MDAATAKQLRDDVQLRARALELLETRGDHEAACELGISVHVIRLWQQEERRRQKRRRARKRQKHNHVARSRPVEITGHARERARVRFRSISDAMLEAHIIEDVRSGLHGRQRASESKPDWCTLYGDRPNHQAQPGQLYVWDEGEQRAYVVSIELHAIVVITSLNRTVSPEMLAA